jgi:FKBP-type peptidyl-prolyl cis-trans isomerase SlpA
VQHVLRQGEHVATLETGAQQQGQQLGVGQCAGPRASSFSRGRWSAGSCLGPIVAAHRRAQEGFRRMSAQSSRAPNRRHEARREPREHRATGSFLTLHYRLSGPDGADVVSTFDDKPATLSLGTGPARPRHRGPADRPARRRARVFRAAAGAAFGQRNPELLQRVKLALLRELGEPDAEYGVGDVVQFPTPDGQGATPASCASRADWLLFDFNHPLAGQPVRFEVQLLGVL